MALLPCLADSVTDRSQADADRRFSDSVDDGSLRCQLGRSAREHVLTWCC
jgi:hypothetical protein